jgi:hypothetical protein
MNHDPAGSKPPTSGLLAVMVLLGFAAVGCAESQPGPSVEEGGLLESPTHEADALRRAEERQEQNRSRNGGGGGY